MGRKAINKDRKEDITKKSAWSKALFPFFQEHGLQRLSIDKMAKYLDISKSTLYEYFSSKEEIILLSVAQKIDEIAPALEFLKDQDRDFEERYWDFFNAVSEKCQDISAHFFKDLQQRYPNEWQIVFNFLQILMEQVEQFYHLGMKAKVFREGNVALLVEQDRHFIFSILTNDQFLIKNNLGIQDAIKDYLSFKFLGLKA